MINSYILYILINLINIAILILNCYVWYKLGWNRGYKRRFEVMSEQINKVLKNIKYGINDSSSGEIAKLGRTKK